MGILESVRRNTIKIGAALLAVMQITAAAPAMQIGQPTVAHAQAARQAEALDRGLVGIRTTSGVFLSWRLLGTDEAGAVFHIYRNGSKIASVTDSTNYLDSSGKEGDSYWVRKVVGGVEKTQSDTIQPLSNNYQTVALNKPADTTLSGETVTYSAGDASAADLDGDGEYEIVLKWDPSNAHDNADKGYTSNVYLDAYKLDGTQLWRIDLGKNIRAGAHYTQFMVYDLDGDGCAEVACKTADGTKDGTGKYIGDSSKDYRNSSGYILSGPEYLTVFNGQTGGAVTTVDYLPARGNVSSWGDSYGNRVDRFLACVAYLNGETPSLVMCRGYYTRTVLVAYDFKNNTLSRKWTFDTNSSTNSNKGYENQGNHNLAVGDVDSDGYDEIVYGSLVIDHNGSVLYCTGLGHGDAGQLGDFDPTSPGLEYFQVHEQHPNSAGTQMRRASDGVQLWGIRSTGDIGRGAAANVSAAHPYYIGWSIQGMFDKDGNQVTMNGNGNMMPNFTVWWDGDLYREYLDGVKIGKWNDATNDINRIFTGNGITSCNGTKSTPCLQADIFGDWREEIIYPTTDSTALRIYTTTALTETKFYTFMHDPVYRLAIAWQNTGYNQPPNTSFYIGPDMSGQPAANIYTVGNYQEREVSDAGEEVNEVTNGSYYRIRNVNSGKYLDVYNGLAENGTNIQQWEGNGATAQLWQTVDAGDGYVQLASQVGDGLRVLDVSGNSADNNANIQLWGNAKSDNQKFKIVPNGDGSFRILTKVSGDSKCLDVAAHSTANGANVTQYTYNDAANQKWIFEKIDYTAPIVDGVTYFIKNVNSGLYMDVYNGIDENNANVQQHPGNGETAQQFRAVDTGDGYFKLVSQVGNAQRVLDVAGNKPADGQNVALYTDKGAANQQFKLSPAGNGAYAILTRCSSDASCVEVSNASSAKGANVQQWTYTGHNCQKWYFEIVR